MLTSILICFYLYTLYEDYLYVPRCSDTMSWLMLFSQWTYQETRFCFPYVLVAFHRLHQRNDVYGRITWLRSCDTSWNMIGGCSWSTSLICDVIHCVCQWPLLFRQHLYFYLFIIQI